MLLLGRTAVRLLSFTARRGRDGILLRWRTGSDAGTLGFRVYRNGARTTDTLIPARTTAAGARYSLLDRQARLGVAYRYRLEAVQRDGSGISLGQVLVRR